MDVPVEGGGGGGGRAADVEVGEGVVVGLAVEVLRLEYDPVAVEYEGVERGGGGGRGGGAAAERRTGPRGEEEEAIAGEREGKRGGAEGEWGWSREEEEGRSGGHDLEEALALVPSIRCGIIFERKGETEGERQRGADTRVW